jgi:hypothetical protein
LVMRVIQRILIILFNDLRSFIYVKL